jgi:TRAP transporter TAXI family solute receptor
MKTLPLAAAAALCLAGTAEADVQLRMEVANPGATAFIIGTHLASVLNERHGYQIEVATGFPGVRSIVNTAGGESDISLYAPALAYYLNNQRAMFANLENATTLAANLRVLFTYEGDLFTFGTYNPEIQTLADLEDRRVFLGPQGAALVNINSALIQAATGLVAGEDYELVHVDWSGSSALLQDGSVDVLFQLCAVGCAAWAELSTSRPVYMLGYTPDQTAQAPFQEALTFPGRHLRTVEPEAFGPNIANDGPITMIGEFTGLVTNASLPDEVAYNLTRAFWETRGDLARVAPFVADFDIMDATFGAINPIHPGSARYLAEQGVPLPAGQ